MNNTTGYSYICLRDAISAEREGWDHCILPFSPAPFSICAVRGYLIFLKARRNAEHFSCDSLSTLYLSFQRKLRVHMLYRS